MPEMFDLLRAVGDAGVRPPAREALRARVQAAIEHEIDAELKRSTSRLSDRFGAVLTAGAAAVAVAVALAAIVFLHQRAPQVSGGQGSQALISRLAVLRRPQRPSDLLPAHLQIVPRTGTIIPGLTRLVASLPGAKLFLVVATPATGAREFWSPSLGDQAAIIAVTPRGSGETLPIPAADLNDAGEVLLAGAARNPAGDVYEVEIVPDGVARVRWAFGDLNGRHRRTIIPHIADNLAVAPALRGAPVSLGATWWAADGSVIPTSDLAYRQAVAARMANRRAQALRALASHQYRAAPALLADFAIFTYTRRAGVRTTAGNVVSHPSVSALPLGILEMASNNQQQLDLSQVRQVTTSAGIQFWVLPGARGLCVFVLDHPSAAIGRLGPSDGAGGSCSANLAQAETQGAGVASVDAGGTTVVGVTPRSHPGVTIGTGPHSHITLHPRDGVYGVRTRFRYG